MIVRTAREMGSLRSLWESLYREGSYTIFQNFLWNLLALSAFSSREQAFVVCAHSPNGAAIVPAAVSRRTSAIQFLGEELFDYRTFLHRGDDTVLKSALAELAQLTAPLEIVAMRQSDAHPLYSGMTRQHFSAAPQIRRGDLNEDQFVSMHPRLARNLRRLNRLGFTLNVHNGDSSRLIRSIYQRKAEQDPDSLFRDKLRIDFLVNAAAITPEVFEVFTLECEERLCAALVTFRDGNLRRFYTGWFDPAYEKHSPGLTLIHEVTRLSLEAGLDCDYMTGEQPYKMRLATRSETLYRVRATSHQLAALSTAYVPLTA
jgi:CelD/BcsL family acetyltransferase involved in cellulose biosynthesis